MARNRTAAVANQVAYDMGYGGVKVTKTLLEGHVQEADDVEWRKRREVLRDRRFSSNFHNLILIIVGLTVFGLALYVDYAIVHEYWERILSNEFGEVSASMVNTVGAKSLQVLFATLAIHYIISAGNGVWRGVYSIVVFGVAFAMLLGIGIVWANASMPEGAKVFVGETTESARVLDQFTRSMGVENLANSATAVPVPEPVSWLRSNEMIIRLVSLGVIFIIVASIGAIALDSAIRAFVACTGGNNCDQTEEARIGRRLNAECASHAAEDASLWKTWWPWAVKDVTTTRERRQRDDLVAEFVRSYTAGVIDRQIDDAWKTNLITATTPDALLTELSSAASGNRAQDDTGAGFSRDPKVTPLAGRM